MTNDDTPQGKRGRKGTSGDDSALPEFHTFGEALFYARSTYGGRLASMPEWARVAMPAQALIAKLAENDYSLSSSAYSSIENSLSLPRDPGRFLQSLYTSLDLDEKSPLAQALARQLARALMRREMGDLSPDL